MENRKKELELEASADELVEEHLAAVSGGANSFGGLPCEQLIGGPLQAVMQSQAGAQKSSENFLKCLCSKEQ